MEINSDFRKQRRDAIVKRNNLNKQRARTMENRIAKVLGGRRVPLSGAGGIKGDVMLNSRYGAYLLECKLSAAWDQTEDCESITLAFSWMDKIEQEVRLMRARFGALVFHYHNVKADYVMMRADWYAIIDKDIMIDGLIIAKETKTIRLTVKKVRSYLKEKPWFFIKHNEQLYVVVDIRRFTALLAEDDIGTI